ncbi:MAG: hypothetical protein ACW986_19945 [Promethearchaeota archaeon]|jgi:hypothetical protein
MSSQLIEQLDLNNLLYLQGTDASVAMQRSLRKFYPEKNIFQNDEKILFRLHGRQFIDMKCSSLKFTITFNKATTAGLPGGAENLFSGSIYNIFKRCRILTSTGKSISDLDNLNLFNRMSSRLYRGGHHNNIIGSTYGLNGSGGSEDDWVADTPYTFVIPMRFLSPFWDNEQLCPPQIAENMSVELFLENTTRCGVSAGGDPLTSYSVTNPEIIADVILVTPAIDSAVSSMSNQRMVYEYKDFVQIESTMSVNAGDLALPLTYPLSNALECFTTIRTVANVNSPNTDSFETTGINTTVPSTDDQFVMRIGSIQLPQARIIGGPEIYNMLLNGRNQLQSNVNTDFDLRRDNLGGKWGVYFANLRRSNLFDNSGREVSNQQNLVAEIKIANPANNIVNMYACYIGRVVINDNYLTIES